MPMQLPPLPFGGGGRWPRTDPDDWTAGAGGGGANDGLLSAINQAGGGTVGGGTGRGAARWFSGVNQVAGGTVDGGAAFNGTGPTRLRHPVDGGAFMVGGAFMATPGPFANDVCRLLA